MDGGILIVYKQQKTRTKLMTIQVNGSALLYTHRPFWGFNLLETITEYSILVEGSNNI